jgi:hypothetical protein
MPESDSEALVPRNLRELVLSYQNTCQVMTRLWFWAMAFLFLALPLGFLAAGRSWVEASVTGGGLWIILGVISRFLVYEFRQLRAGWVAKRIKRGIPEGQDRWKSLIRWIGENNDGNFLNTILKKLGVPPRFASAYAVPHQESLDTPFRGFDELAGSLLGRFEGPMEDGTSHTCVYTTTQTQELRDGEWVTVESETTSNGNITPDEAMRRAMAMLQEEASAVAPPEALPLSQGPQERASVAAEAGGSREARRRRGFDHLPLELDEFQPDEEEEEPEPAVGATRSSRD